MKQSDENRFLLGDFIHSYIVVDIYHFFNGEFVENDNSDVRK